MGYVGGYCGGLDDVVVLVCARLGWAFDQELFNGSFLGGISWVFHRAHDPCISKRGMGFG
jgi:hypothetical protein